MARCWCVSISFLFFCFVSSPHLFALAGAELCAEQLASNFLWHLIYFGAYFYCSYRFSFSLNFLEQQKRNKKVETETPCIEYEWAVVGVFCYISVATQWWASCCWYAIYGGTTMDVQQFHLLSQRMFSARFNNYKTMTINEINYCAHLRLIYISDFMIIVFTGFLACPLPSYRHREMRLSSVDSIRFSAQTTFDLLWWWGRITTPYFIRNWMTIFYLWPKKAFLFRFFFFRVLRNLPETETKCNERQSSTRRETGDFVSHTFPFIHIVLVLVRAKRVTSRVYRTLFAVNGEHTAL